MDKKDIKVLLKKYRAGTATDQEIALLESWYMHYNEPDHNQELTPAERLEIFDEVWRNLEKLTAKNHKNTWPKWLPAAASVIICCSIGFYFYIKRANTINTPAQDAQVIKPGSNKAMLTLSNGKQIMLNDAYKGQLAREAGMRITKDKKGEITYIADKTTNADIKFNSIETPKGGQWHLILQDGTNVWLNAASSIKFPVKFSGDERHVELTGEAYFEVAKNKAMPFTITANKVNVKVLGTHFNVMAYKDEDVVNTTLLEGSVQLSTLKSHVILLPGQQGSVDQNGSINTSFVNTADAVSWKNGYFVFRKENITSIMKKISRWYDVDVAYHDDLSQVAFGGSISRSGSIQELLDNIALTGSVHFKIEGRKVNVYK